MEKCNSRATIKNTSVKENLFDKTKDGKNKFSYRMKRWIIIISIHLLFFLSFHIDIQTLEGTLNGSRLQLLLFNLYIFFLKLLIFYDLVLPNK